MTDVYSFDHHHGVPAKDLWDLLGGKGAGLAEMTSALGLNVPPGFTIAVPVCREYLESGWPSQLDEVLAEHVDRLGDLMDRRLGDARDPLLLAVRSGAPISMPGMLDTVLNLGLNDETVEGLARNSGDDWFAWDSYRRFLTMYATIVMGVPGDVVGTAASSATASHLRAQIQTLKSGITEAAGRPVPQDPMQQLREAVEAVFRSWGSDRARTYRAHDSIDDDMGTGCNIQAMVFGNRGTDSGTGVVFTRDPATGKHKPYGDYLPRAQGEDVVAGSASTMPIAHLDEHQPDAYADLLRALRRIEVHYRDVCDVEFTVEDGKLWLLQTRIGKRGAVAAVRIAADMVDDPDIALTPDEAVARVSEATRVRARAEIIADAITRDDGAQVLGKGLGASPGRVSGRVVLTAEDAICADDDVILIRPTTSPEDVAGMAAAAGIVTIRGGLVSHAAVVARGWGIPAVVSADWLTLTADEIRADDVSVHAGDIITIDGMTGHVWIGELSVPGGGTAEVIAERLPHLARIEDWAMQAPSSTAEHHWTGDRKR